MNTANDDKHYLLPIVNGSGMKKTWIAHKLGLSSAQLSQYLHGAREMPERIEEGLRAMLSIDKSRP